MKLLIAILLLVLTTFAQNTTYKDGTECDCDSLFITYTASEANAVSGDTNITEDAEREIPFKNGTINGMWKRYYESGSIRSEVPYINGTRNGMGKRYYESGSIELEVPFKNGNENGVVKWYYESGALNGTESYKNGKAHGVDKWYYENGKLAGTATYKNGKLVGYKKCTDGRFGNERLNCLK